MDKPCPFCKLPASRILGGNELAIIAGDNPGPRGGVRWVLPEKAKYWA